jgi:predicted AlkP superfamily phosphohydrolase/phosphomutase
MTSNVLLIGLDGATFTLLNPLMEEGVMPFLRSFMDGGVRADLRTIIPPLTPPAWTSLLTGRTPGHHGVFDFFQLETPGSKHIRLTTSKDVRVATVADRVNQAGLRATVLNFPVHFPPPAIDGNVVAGWMPWRQLRLGCSPDSLYDQLRTLPGFNARELAMDMAQEARATEGDNEEEYSEWAELHARREEQWRDVVCHLMAQRPTPLTAILLDGPDKVQHLCWRFLDPALSMNLTPEEQRIRESCLNYYARLDRVLADIVTSAGPETTIVMASDHGFGATTEVFHINSWLAQAGYLTWKEGVRADGTADGILGMRQLTRHTEWFDWQQTQAYAATPTSNGIHIVIAEENQGHGVPQALYAQFRAELIDTLLHFRDPIDGEPVVTEVWTREEIFPGEASMYAPDLTLTLRDGGLVSILPSELALQPRLQPGGTHRPVGIFAAHGPGIKQGWHTGELSILDIAPMILYSLGLGIPSDLEGRVPLEVYEPAFRAKQRVTIQSVPTQSNGSSSAKSNGELTDPERVSGAKSEDKHQASAGAHSNKASPVYGEEAEAAIMARLRSLGYIE